MSHPHDHNPYKKPSLFWPLFLIAIGSILLLSNLGILPPNSMDLLWRFWPLVLVIIGLDILLGRRSALGSIITSLVAILLLGGVLAFLFFAKDIPTLVKEVDLGTLNHATIKQPLQEVKTATVFIDWPAGPASLYALSDSNNLIEGELDYYGKLSFVTDVQGDQADVKVDTRREQFFIDTSGVSGEEENWQIGLHPRVAINLTLDSGSGSAEYDLTDLDIRSLNVDSGSGSVDMVLPQLGQIEGTIDTGSGSLTITIPDDMAAKITLNEGSGSFSAGNRFSQKRSGEEDDGNIIWLTEDFVGAENYVELTIDQGSGSITVQ